MVDGRWGIGLDGLDGLDNATLDCLNFVDYDGASSASSYTVVRCQSASSFKLHRLTCSIYPFIPPEIPS
jgi:hypothetical protein